MLPQSVAAIDADWLTAALSRDWPGTVVTRADQGSVIHGTATKVRLLLDYNDAGHAHGLPPSMWFKGGLEAHSASDDMLAVYAAEAGFYRDIAPKLDMVLPRSFHVDVDAATGQSAILFEDMLARNARFGHATRPASPKLAASVLRQLAKLHGAFWQSDSLSGNAALVKGGQVLRDFLEAFLFTPENWTRCLALPRGTFLTGELTDRETMWALVQKMLAEDRARRGSLVHGDAHLGNICILPGDEASYVDWQTAMLGFWAHDVSYFLTAALTIEDRRAHERDLIAHYVSALNEAGGTLDFDTAWWEYRRHALYTFCWFPCNPEWQPEEVTATNTERAVAAMMDLDTLGCWRGAS
jgi:Phosphotransferase enzyme family